MRGRTTLSRLVLVSEKRSRCGEGPGSPRALDVAAGNRRRFERASIPRYPGLAVARKTTGVFRDGARTRRVLAVCRTTPAITGKQSSLERRPSSLTPFAPAVLNQGSSRVQPHPVPLKGGWSVSRSTTHDLSVRRESHLNTRTPVRIRARIPRSRFRGRLQCWWLPVFVYINTAWRRPLTPARKTVGFDSPFKPYPHIGVVLLTSKSGSILLGRSPFPSLDVRGVKLDSPKCAFEPLYPRIYHRMSDSNCL